MTHTDIFGTNIEVGDTVAFNQPTYKNLIKGIVIKITEKSIRVRYTNHCNRVKETIEQPKNCVVKKGLADEN